MEAVGARLRIELGRAGTRGPPSRRDESDMERDVLKRSVVG